MLRDDSCCSCRIDAEQHRRPISRRQIQSGMVLLGQTFSVLAQMRIGSSMCQTPSGSPRSGSI